MVHQKLLNDAVNIGISAGKGLVLAYNSNKKILVQTKVDKSPVTDADINSNNIITKELSRLYPDIPILSEESPDIDFAIRKNWQRLWLIDPLDGTKEFINRTGDFTVNIALVENGIPVLGVVVVPTKDTVYFALRGANAYKQVANNAPEQITTKKTFSDRPLRIAVSRYHFNEKRLQVLLRELGMYELVTCGSTLKICLIAEGLADIYPRIAAGEFGGTSEWDTAAGQCILEAAGGMIMDLKRNSLIYNAREALRNPSFIAAGSKELLDILPLAKL